ncbi:hypothetical protein MJO28_002734 [Puccinia striiformis f. sp. tritici]|uniref:Uncharacterized protein n=5 Tax=Puccinia striiformis TaxID=27350 RepID=A0A0L0V2E8_9BASI|nr:hypothetical protein Pst134EA_005302 [Puccinia striiformis f. sp. tritici]KNE93169.1 hypothetical protein PSTG_13421 [Puccinia striiformis f. sp. tritici PST-78]POV95056.1 hypothetical protein PSHT_15871 [Puccinia striiformis]KAH9462498.1 hypothetical protein Pst134EB_006390 [Puccinia striiformis f. sp. tritici]KAH9471403.1 hypothetical protein Pst134EA_005302 [Puccinia striiformis f. sp. tritici]KAI7958943.1 hypothetical protein MJO28_002734 [Puccinia striiformis f. sp. tritici]
MFSEEPNQWFTNGSSEFNFAMPHSQGQSNDKILPSQYQHQSGQTSSYCPPDNAVSHLGLLGVFQPIDYSQEHDQLPFAGKQAPGPSIESISPKSLSFCGLQMSGSITPTAGLGPHSNQLIQQDICNQSLSLMNIGTPVPPTSYVKYEGENMGYQTKAGYQKDSVNNIGQRAEELSSFPFNMGFQSDVGSYMSSASPPAILENSKLGQPNILGADITNFLDSILKGPESMPIDCTQDNYLADSKPLPPNCVGEVRGNRLPQVHGVVQPQRGYQAGVLKPLQNGSQVAVDVISDSLRSMNYQQEIRPSSDEPLPYFHDGMSGILDLPRIARNPPSDFSSDSGTDLDQKRKFSEEEAGQKFISCRTIKTTRRVMTGGKKSQGAATYCPLITVSIPSIPWVPEINYGSKTYPKNVNPKRTKGSAALRKKAKLEKN